MDAYLKVASQFCLMSCVILSQCIQKLCFDEEEEEEKKTRNSRQLFFILQYNWPLEAEKELEKQNKH